MQYHANFSDGNITFGFKSMGHWDPTDTKTKLKQSNHHQTYKQSKHSTMRDGLPVVKSRGLCLMPRHEMGKYGQMILENGNVKSPYICLDDYYVFTLVNVEIVPENVVKNKSEHI